MGRLRERLRLLYEEAAVLPTVAGRMHEARVRHRAVAAPGSSRPRRCGLLFAAAIKLEDGGPVFFAQERVGLGGRAVHALKFRSMRPDAEAGRRGAGSEDDPRVTRVGRLHARDRDGRAAAALEHLARRHELRRAARAAARRDRSADEAALVRLEDVPGFAHRITVRPGPDRHRADLRAARRAAAAEVPLQSALRRRRSWWLDVRLILAVVLD